MNMKRILLLSMVFSFVFVFNSWAQRTVSGTVTDENGEGLPGVNVVIKGTTTGVTTDLNGDYQISVPDDETVLVFSSVGMETQEITVGARSVIDVQMSEDAQELQEVVVTGYASTIKEKASISTVEIKSDKIVNRPNTSVAQRLTGQVAGLSITTASGQPGGNSTINLRGVSSINGDTEPLFIIDGAPVDQDNFRSLNPNEIESITVLKDAGATAIYGNRGANGVIVIKTKRGEFGSPLKVDYSFLGSVSQLQDNDYDLMNSQEQLRLERAFGSGLGAQNITADDLADPNFPGWVNRERTPGPLTDAEITAAPTTDWADFFFDDASAQQHTISISGGGANNAVFLSFGYTDQQGILEASSLERYNVRTNITGQLKDSKLNYGLNLSVNYSENSEPNNIGSGAINRNLVLSAYQSVPWHLPGDYTNGQDLQSPLLFSRTPLFMIDRLRTFTRTEDEVKIIGSLNLSYEIIDGLTAAYVLSADFQDENLLSAEGPESFNAILFGGDGNETPGTQDQQNTRQFTMNHVASLSYDFDIGKHNINAGLYSEIFTGKFNTFGFRAEGLNPKTFSPGDGSAFVPDNANTDLYADVANANRLQVGLFSYFGRVSYDYDRRYGAELTVRRDASSRFNEDNRWATFYSVSGRWNVHNEAFFNVQPINTLKLRASFGTNGNQIVSGSTTFSAPDLYLDQFVTGNGYGGASAIFLGGLGINTLRWEQSEQLDVGLDVELFDSRLGVTLDGYIKNTKDLFQNTPISAINGQYNVESNTGELQNRGIDWTLRYDILRSTTPEAPFLSVTFLGNYNVSEIKKLPSEDGEIVGIGREGGPLDEYFTYRYAGVNPANGNLLFLTADGEVTENPNVDTDRVWLNRNIYPDAQGSLNLDFEWRNFFVSTQVQYTLGTDRFDNDLAGFQNPDNIGQFRSSRDLNRAWHPDNPNTDIPSLTAGNRNLTGTRYLFASDFVRLRFAQVGYNFPKAITDRLNLRTLRVYVNGENLVTWTEWRGFDPEALSNTSRLYPTPRIFAFGVDVGF